VEIENRFPWGNVQLLLTLRQGRVDDLEVYSDAMDADFAGEVKALLAGAAFGAEALAQALEGSDNDQIRELAAYIRANA